MKTFLILFAAIFISISSLAQNGINYKAIIKDDNGNVVANQTIDIQFIIYEGSALTNIAYFETHTPTTDANGLIIVNIGEGASSYVFSDVDWGKDEHWLNVSIDTGSGYFDMGTTQFMAVPYALSSGDHPWTKNEDGIHVTNNNVGIGIANPEAQLDVRGGDWNLEAGNPGDLRIGNATNNFRIGVATGGGGAGITRMYTNSNALILGSNDTPALIFESNGEIKAPQLTNSKIENAGNQSIITKKYADDNYVKDTPVVREIMLSGASFQPVGNYKPVPSELVGGPDLPALDRYYFIQGIFYGLSDGGIYMAPVNLPVGSTITSMSAYLFDSSLTNLEFKFYYKYLPTNYEYTFFTLTSDNSNSNQVLTYSTPIPILSNYSYYILIHPPLGHDWGDHGIKGVKIIYTE